MDSYVLNNLDNDKSYYSLDIMENIERCKVDKDYLGEVMIANENLIWFSIHKYVGDPDTIAKNYGIEKDDILQLGRVGFIKSIKAFDTTRGIKFSSFAVIAIVREVRSFLRDNGAIIRPTRTAHNLIKKINQMEYTFGELPTTEELAELLDENEDKITKAMLLRKVLHLNMYEKDDESSEVEESVVSKVYVESVLKYLKSKLTEKEFRIFESRMRGLNQKETAKNEGVSQMRISRVMKKVAKLLNTYSQNDTNN